MKNICDCMDCREMRKKESEHKVIRRLEEEIELLKCEKLLLQGELSHEIKMASYWERKFHERVAKGGYIDYRA